MSAIKTVKPVVAVPVVSVKASSTIAKVVSFIASANVIRTGLGVTGRTFYHELADEIKLAKVDGKLVKLDNRTNVKIVIKAMILADTTLPEETTKRVNTLATGVMRTAGMYRTRSAVTGKMVDTKDAIRAKKQTTADKSFDMVMFKSAMKSIFG